MQSLLDIKTVEEPLVEPEPEPEPRVPLRDRLNERFPRLAQWLGERLDWDLSAVTVSLIVHGVLILILMFTGYRVASSGSRTFQASSVDTGLSEFDRSQAFQDIDQAVEAKENTPTIGSFSPNLTTLEAAGSKTIASAMAGIEADKKSGARIELAHVDVQRTTERALPSASIYNQTVSIRGNGAEHVGSAEGAVDRIADEILRRVEKGRTLVVWAFDASGSLVAERERLAKHIDTVYKHTINRDENHSTEGGLLTTVVAFGQDRKTMLSAPTADPAEIIKAIHDVPLDETGFESTFQTVADIVRKWGHYKAPDGNVYKAMVIVVTDEIGDDEPQLEGAIKVAVEAKVPVYVLGSQALFSRVEGRVAHYKHPKTGVDYYNLPVKQGPESVMPEQIRLPFWYGGYQYDLMNSGFGPYALSRLTNATGGIFFITRLGEVRMGFDPASLREYKPDWVSRTQYEAAVRKDPIREAVINAALITQQNLPSAPGMSFPAVDGPEFKEEMERNQAIAARTAYTVDAALEPINSKEMVKARDRETSRRWQAHYDLARGRLLAMKVRCYEYNWACAEMKKNPRKFTKPDSNAWQLAPDEEIHFSDKAAAAGKQAIEILKKVVAEHRGTPWAMLAERELKDPLGFKWVETKRQPIVRNNNPPPAARKNAMMKNMPKPPDPPKL
jgi:hypothetical protein